MSYVVKLIAHLAVEVEDREDEAAKIESLLQEVESCGFGISIASRALEADSDGENR